VQSPVKFDLVPSVDACGHTRNETMRSIAIVVMTAIMAMPAAANEQPVRLKQGSGLDKVESNCGACHSLDYIPMNSPFLNAVGWDAEVTKMINAFGAPIDQADVRVIAEYLGTNYGLGLRPDSPRAPEGSNPPQRYGSAGIRPKGLASRPPARIGTQWRPPLDFSRSTKVLRGPRAASRRHPGAETSRRSHFSRWARREPQD
jgi:hypothetical protein